MKKFFIQLTVFLFPFAVILYFVLKRHTIDPNTLEYRYGNEINSYNWVNKLDSVYGFILGSSTLKYGLSSHILGHTDAKWINLSDNARDPIVMYILLKRYFPLKQPKFILVGLDPWIYSKRYYIYRNDIMYLDLNTLETVFMLQQDKTVLNKKAQLIFAGFNKSVVLDNHLDGSKTNADSIPEDLGSVKLNATAKNFADVPLTNWFEIAKYHWSDIEFTYLKKIKDYCHKNNIKLLFIIPPKRNDYNNIAETTFSKDHKEWWKKINDILSGEHFIGNYKILNAYKQDSIFADPCHLNQNGQAVFSEYIRQHIDSPQLIYADNNFY